MSARSRRDTSFVEVTPKNWSDAKRIGNNLGFHAFRGHADAHWGLESTIERAGKQFGVAPGDLVQQEKNIVDLFKRNAHQYIQSLPKDDDNVEWLSLIREHGGPTRLLDFTTSFYIAAFFAMEDAARDACVWAINTILPPVFAGRNKDLALNWSDSEHSLRTQSSERAEFFIRDATKREQFVLEIEPDRLSERQAIQKGVFFFPFDLSKGFEANLCATFHMEPDRLRTQGTHLDLSKIRKGNIFWDSVEIVKIILPRKWHKEAISDLYQMNIDAASLFPGLDGFARSLKYPIRLKENTRNVIREASRLTAVGIEGIPAA